MERKRAEDLFRQFAPTRKLPSYVAF